MSVEALVLREECDGIVTLTLNRPKQQNALSEAMLDQLQAALDDVGRNPRARVVVLGGAGPNFCAGHDLKEMLSRPDRSYYHRLF